MKLRTGAQTSVCVVFRGMRLTLLRHIRTHIIIFGFIHATICRNQHVYVQKTTRYAQDACPYANEIAKCDNNITTSLHVLPNTAEIYVCAGACRDSSFYASIEIASHGRRSDIDQAYTRGINQQTMTKVMSEKC